IILMDEPFAGIDPQTVGDIQQIVRDLKRQGIGILITDHQVREILAVTDRIYVIHSGKVLTHGSPQEIVTNPMVIREYLGSNFAQESAAVLSPPAAAPPAEPAPAPPPARAAGHLLVEREQIHR